MASESQQRVAQIQFTFINYYYYFYYTCTLILHRNANTLGEFIKTGIKVNELQKCSLRVQLGWGLLKLNLPAKFLTCTFYLFSLLKSPNPVFRLDLQVVCRNTNA